MKKHSFGLVFGLLATLVASSLAAAEWGSLKGRFVLDGTPAKLPPIVVNKDEQFCGPHNPKNETIVVGKNNGLVNAAVYLRAPFGKKVEVNPNYESKLKEPAVLDNNGCSFKPHVLAARQGQKLVIKNSDAVGHNTNVTLLVFNQLIPAQGQAEVAVSQVAAVPSPIACNIHPWMKGYLVSLNHPYVAISGEDGSFEIKDIPAGQNEFQFWHETGYLRNVQTKGGKTDARTGRVKLTIPAGGTLDLGDIKIPASSLRP